MKIYFDMNKLKKNECLHILIRNHSIKLCDIIVYKKKMKFI